MLDRINKLVFFKKKAVNNLDQTYMDCVPVLKALADETRLSILNMLRDGELCACNIQDHFEISQPTLSYHMKILMQSRLVTGRKDGLWMRYSINKENFEPARELLSSFMQSSDQESVCLCGNQKSFPTINKQDKENR